jgi:hypothetical protein
MAAPLARRPVKGNANKKTYDSAQTDQHPILLFAIMRQKQCESLISFLGK